MERYLDMSEVSNGRRYTSNELLKLECEDCKGCSSCCEDMGTSILLDPYDFYQLSRQTKQNFHELLAQSIDLGVVENVILPHLRMVGNKPSCVYLSQEGRCTIHGCRPGFCRLFPLGRIYENGQFSYFLQKNECHKGGRSKLKIRKWIGIEPIVPYEKFVTRWHYLIKDISERSLSCGEEWVKQKNIQLLKLFFEQPYLEIQDFYLQFEQRVDEYCK